MLLGKGMPYVCISHFLNVSLCSYQGSTSTIQSVLTSQVKAMRKYGLWVVWFQKDIPTEMPNGHPISWKEVLTRKMPFI